MVFNIYGYKRDEKMKIKSNYFILCEKAIVSNKGNFSFINTFDKIYADKVPAGYPSMSLVYSGIVDDPKKLSGSLKYELIFMSPNKKKHLVGEGELDYSKEKGPNIFLLMEIANAKFNEFGKYIAILKLEGKKIATTPIELVDKKVLEQPVKRKK